MPIRPTAWIAAAVALASCLQVPARSAERLDVAQALEAQRQVVAETPSPDGFTDLGNLLVMAGQVEEAESIYRKVLAMDPSHAGAPFNLGLLLQYRGDSEEAFALFEQVIALAPDHAWAHYQIGSIHEAADRRTEAIASYARALALDPELYFADVNPQIVDNGLVTESLLAAAEMRQPSRLAPMRFSRPREITRLLLNLPAPDTGTADPNDPQR